MRGFSGIVFGTISPPTLDGKSKKDEPRMPPGADVDASWQTYLDANQPPPRNMLSVDNLLFWMLFLFFDHHSFDACLLFRDIPYVTQAFIYPLGSHIFFSFFLSLRHHRHLGKANLTPSSNHAGQQRGIVHHFVVAYGNIGL